MEIVNGFNSLNKGLYQSDSEVFKYNQAIIKDYGSKYKLTAFKGKLRQAGFEAVNYKKKGTVNQKKLDRNFSRAKSTILELGLCNHWDYFIGKLTLSEEKGWDRSDLNTYSKALAVWIHNYNRLNGCKVEYVLVPEKHEDNINWHMHGFLRGLPEGAVVRNKYNYLDWAAYAEKFGHITLSPVRSQQRSATYISKYIEKNIEKNRMTELNAHLYYCSNRLKRAVEIKRGTLSDRDRIPQGFDTEYAVIKWSGKRSSDLSKLILLYD